MDITLIAFFIFGGVSLFGFAVSAILLWRDRRVKRPPLVSKYWREIYAACKRAERVRN